MATTILIADDHEIVRAGLRLLLESQGFEIVAEATDGRDAVEQALRFDPDVAVLDLFMPTLNGIDAAKQLAHRAPHTRTLLLTASNDDEHVIEALEAGVTGYVEKTRAATELAEAIREVARGGVFFAKASSRELAEACLARQLKRTNGNLTSRERQVLQLVAEGNTTKDIAGKLGISFKTAESHRGRIMKKLDLHETASLVRYAIRHGLIEA
jgi:DNA-binding NarL/FixJ family response regulator